MSALGSGSQAVPALLALRSFFHSKGAGWITRLISLRLERTYGCYIHVDARIDKNCSFPHPIGIVIGAGVKIGEDVSIFQHVTLGGANWGDSAAGRHPEIGNNTTIFAGAKILGPVRVGNHCTIGANAVVIEDVPNHHTAVGIPARCIKKEISQGASGAA